MELLLIPDKYGKTNNRYYEDGYSDGRVDQRDADQLAMDKAIAATKREIAGKLKELMYDSCGEVTFDSFDFYKLIKELDPPVKKEEGK